MERSLGEARQSLKQSEECYQLCCTHWAVRREEIELTAPELGVRGWATVTVVKFRGAQVAVKIITTKSFLDTTSSFFRER